MRRVSLMLLLLAVGSIMLLTATTAAATGTDVAAPYGRYDTPRLGDPATTVSAADLALRAVPALSRGLGYVYDSSGYASATNAAKGGCSGFSTW